MALRPAVRALLAAAALLSAGLRLVSPAMAGDLTITSWGGAYTDAQHKVFFEPFAKATGSKINSVEYDGSLDELRGQVNAGNVSWDVVAVEVQAAVQGCKEGIFEPVGDEVQLPPTADGSPASEDFLPHVLHKCAVGTDAWSFIIAYADGKFGSRKPATIADFFDLGAFPGKRGLKKSPQANLEWALVADGVPSADVYSVLATPQGVDRAFAKLDTVKHVVQWWEVDSQPLQPLVDGELVMTSAYSFTIAGAIIKRQQPLHIVWDHEIWSADLWAVPEGSRNRDEALQFIAFASRPDRMADLTNYLLLGPVRKSAMTMVKPYIRAQLPTSPEKLNNAIWLDFNFWASHAAALSERFNKWLNST